MFSIAFQFLFIFFFLGGGAVPIATPLFTSQERQHNDKFCDTTLNCELIHDSFAAA